MSKSSNQQKLSVLNVWLEDNKKNNKYRKQQKKQPKWLTQALKDLDDDD